jgi:hypothetical protein
LTAVTTANVDLSAEIDVEPLLAAERRSRGE